jgi:hypothetical protein
MLQAGKSRKILTSTPFAVCGSIRGDEYSTPSEGKLAKASKNFVRVDVPQVLPRSRYDWRGDNRTLLGLGEEVLMRNTGLALGAIVVAAGRSVYVEPASGAPAEGI